MNTEGAGVDYDGSLSGSPSALCLLLVSFRIIAPTGKRLMVPHWLHRTSNRSAHGFAPFLLGFTIPSLLDFPEMSNVLHRLHIVCLTLGARRICVFLDTPRR